MEKHKHVFLFQSTLSKKKNDLFGNEGQGCQQLQIPIYSF